MKEGLSIMKTDQNVAFHYDCFSITFLNVMIYTARRKLDLLKRLQLTVITKLGDVIKLIKLCSGSCCS